MASRHDSYLAFMPTKEAITLKLYELGSLNGDTDIRGRFTTC